MLTVHHLQRSQSERIVWLCEELSIPYDLKLYQRNPLLSPPDLAALHPLGAAPLITDDASGLRLAESSAIVDYINYKYGEGRLALAPSHANYADYLYWFHFANANLQAAMTRSMYFGMLKLGGDNPWQQHIDEKLASLIKLIDDRLKESEWLAGDEFTAAEIVMVFSLTTMRVFQPVDLHGYGGILRWLQVIGKRPGYIKAMGKAEPSDDPALDAKNPPLHPALAG